MTQISNKKAFNTLLVGLGNWQAELAGQLCSPPGQVQWCDNVYEAVALISRRERSGGEGRSGTRKMPVVVQVDCLSSDELQVFSCLGRVGSVATIAVSAIGNGSKLNQARLLGAGRTVMLSELGELLNKEMVEAAAEIDRGGYSTVGEESPLSHDDPKEQPAEEPLENILEPIFDADENGGTTEPEISNEPDKEADPLLSQEELDSLLG